MSTILDSLKKSSDQRNNSDKGSLDRFNFGNGKESSSSFSKIIIVLFIALLLAGSFWVYQNYFATDEIKSVVESTQAPKETVKKSVKTPDELKPAQQNRKKERPNSDVIKAQIKKLKEQKEQAQIQQREARLSDLNRNNSSFVKKEGEKDIYDKIKSQRSLIKTNKYKAEENKQKPLQPPVKKEPVLAHQEKNKATSPTQSYRLLYQLPFAIRKEIPEIKLNIHVYDEQPENRIAIINGTRFAIDDMITDQLLLKDILVNGILLDYNGNEFFIPN